MKQEQLRIGNWVKLLSTGEIVQVNLAMFSAAYLHEEADDYTYFDWVLPIPLTEQVLLDCGFKQEAENYWAIEHFKISFQQDKFWYLFENYSVDFNIPDIEIKSLHQLQNVYYALTEEELTYQPRPI